jgi:hypothetical protein
MAGNRGLFINGYLDSIAKQFVQDADPQKNRNLAFETFAQAVILDKPFEEVHDLIQSPGPNDGGFDGIYFEDLGDYYIMHIFQCKNTENLSQNEIDKFRSNYTDIFENGNRIGLGNILDIQKWIDEYRQITLAKYIIEPRLYFIFNGEKDKAGTKNPEFYSKFHRPDDGFYIYDAEDLYQKISTLAKQKRDIIKFTFAPEASNVSLRDHQALFSFVISNIKAANFRIRALDICELIENEIKINGNMDFLFEENIRSFLGYRAKANQRMRETLENSQEAIYFPFLNNGITLICDELTIPTGPQDGKYVVPVTNPQIVNGLQTSVVLYKMFKSKKENLDNVFVNVRVYETRDKALLNKITDATNTQTPINYRDKVSTKLFTENLQVVFKNAGIGLIVKRGDSFSPATQKNFNDHVNIDTVIKFWYATFYEQPEKAKDSISSILQEIYDATSSGRHQLQCLFNGSKDSPIYPQMLFAYKIYKYVQSKKPSMRETYDFVGVADEMLSYGIYREIATSFQNISLDTDLDTTYIKVIEKISIVLIEQRKLFTERGVAFSYNGFFKKPICRDRYNEKVGLIETEGLIDNLLKLEIH